MKKLSLGILISIAAISCFAGVKKSFAQENADVTIDAKSTLGFVPAQAFGVNVAVWDSHMTDPEIAGAMKNLGVTVLRYPGGSTSDEYHWAEHSATPVGKYELAASTRFDRYMDLVKKVGAVPIITVNYGANKTGTGGGDPEEAAAWVKYANITKKYAVKYWEIGNEIYGNGYYGGSWETDKHVSLPQNSPDRKANPNLSPTAYGHHVLEFVRAMKAVDPTVKIGAVLCAPGFWPDAQPPQDWNKTVLGICGKQIDFAIAHWYPQNPGDESDAGLLGSTSKIPAMTAALQKQLAEYCGARRRPVEIWITETNSVSSRPGKQSTGIVNALFAADDYMSWLESGVTSVDWWQLHNGPVTDGNNGSALHGATNFGDYGLLANGDKIEPPLNTPFPAYKGLEFLAKLVGPGDRMIEAVSDQPLLTVHAVKRKDGDIGLLLINKSPAQTYTVHLAVRGIKKIHRTVFQNLSEDMANVSNKSGVSTVNPNVMTVAPYSLTTVALR